MSRLVTRRGLVTAGALGAGTLLAGCDKVIQVPAARRILFAGEDMQRGLQRALTDRGALAREYSASEMSPVFDDCIARGEVANPVARSTESPSSQAGVRICLLLP